MREKSNFDSVECKLRAFQQAQQEEESQREKEQKEREEADEQWKQEVHRKRRACCFPGHGFSCVCVMIYEADM